MIGVCVDVAVVIVDNNVVVCVVGLDYGIVIGVVVCVVICFVDYADCIVVLSCNVNVAIADVGVDDDDGVSSYVCLVAGGDTCFLLLLFLFRLAGMPFVLVM